MIETQIVNGEIRIGDQLPIEKELASRYRVSRTVVREAMKALKEKGWVETFVGKGTFVIDNVAKGIDSSIDLVLRMDPGSSFDYLIEVRQILEPEIAAMAAHCASDEQLLELREAVDLMSWGLVNNDNETYLRGDLEFHMGMAKAAGNPLVLMILNPVVKIMREQQEYHLYRVNTGGHRSQKNHQLIMNALEKHDEAAARKWMREHILQVRADVVYAANKENRQSNPNPSSQTIG